MRTMEIGNIIVNVDHVTQVLYTLQQPVKELADGDIYNVFVTLHLTDGNTVSVTEDKDLTEVVAWLSNADGRMFDNERNIKYYVAKMLEYKRVVGKKEKK